MRSPCSPLVLRRHGSPENRPHDRHQRSSSSDLSCSAALFLVCGLTVSCAAPQAIDLLLHNGRIFTSDSAVSTVEALAIDEGKIVAVGGEDLRRHFAAATVIDLEGRTVFPGFIDTHTHIEGRSRRFIDLNGVSSIVEIQRRVRAKARELGPGEWISGYGWSEDELAEGRRPLRADLDLAAPHNPVVLSRAGGHSAVASSRALELAGIDRTTPDPESGIIERDEEGEPNGIIRERHDLLLDLVPAATPEEIRDSLFGQLRAQLELGITSLVQASATVDGYAHWRTVYDQHRDELPRAAVQLHWLGAEAMAEAGLEPGQGNEHLRLGAIKIFADGGFTGPAAFTREPYRGEATYRGSLTMPEEELRRLIGEVHEAGWQLGIHAIGDAAIELVVDALADALEQTPRENHRHYLNHFTVPPSDETIERMAKLGIAVTQQANFTYTLEGRYVEYLDGDRLERNNPLRSLLDRGVHLALSSDILPMGPFVGLYAATTRRGRSGRVFADRERLTLEEAVVAYTRSGAYLTFEEDVKGSLCPGNLADFIVLSADPFSLDPSDLLEIRVLQTFVGGRKLFDSGEQKRASTVP